MIIECAWKSCERKWEGRWEAMPNEWGWPSRSQIDFLKPHGLITQESDSPVLCEAHMTELQAEGAEPLENLYNSRTKHA
jgi:hypothetical protein